MEMNIAIISTLVSFAGFLVAFAVYQLSKQHLRESWLKNYGEIHTIFWNDDDIKAIRHCVTYDSAYESLKATLLHEQEIEEQPTDKTQPLKEEEYVLLDKLDKFLNLFERAGGIRPEITKYRDLWRDLFFQAWLDYCLAPNRPELVWYIHKNYQNLITLHEKFKNDSRSRIANKRVGVKK